MLYQLTLLTAFLWPVQSIESKIEGACQMLVEEVLPLVEDQDSSVVFSLSIAAPEFLRYQELSNLMEVQALRLMYAEFGSEKMDFSVGYFQMKPSFIEALEKEILRDENLTYSFSDLISFTSHNPSDRRQSRIDRILSLRYCFRYLIAFERIARSQYASELDGLTVEEQLQFLATAYNMGLGSTGEEVRNYQSKEHFPYGSGYKGEQYAFGDLSIRIYDQLNKLLCIPSH